MSPIRKTSPTVQKSSHLHPSSAICSLQSTRRGDPSPGFPAIRKGSLSRRHSLFALSGLLTGLLGVPRTASAQSRSALPPQQEPPQIAYCFHSRKEFPLTANPQDRHWRYISPVIMAKGLWGESIANHRTEVRARWTAQHLYFLISGSYEALNAKPNPQFSGDSPGLENFDVAEVFLAPNPQQPHHYFSFALSPAAEWQDGEVTNPAPIPASGPRPSPNGPTVSPSLSAAHLHANLAWNSGWAVKCRIDAAHRQWHAEMRIPYSSLSVPGSPAPPQHPFIGQEMLVNFSRSQGAGQSRRHLAWSAPHAETPHNPHAFQLLRFVTK